jgi:hypothetical protein
LGGGGVEFGAGDAHDEVVAGGHDPLS